MSKRIYISFLLLFVFALGETFAQGEPIYLTNASFEDMARPGIPPRGWYDCGRINFPNETPPDVHPEFPVPSFGVSKVAYEGGTYLGMVVRENDSWESVAQRLKTPLRAGQCYSFSIALATSKKYISKIRGSEESVNFVKPLKLRIWGGNGYCEKKELLAESGMVNNEDWEEFDFKLEPKQRANYIILEAFFKTPTLSPPNGNILLDNASAFLPIPCDEDAKPVAKKPVVQITNPGASRKRVEENFYELVTRVTNVKEKRKILLKVNGRNNRDFIFNPITNQMSVRLKLKEGINKISVRASNAAGNAKDEATIVYEPPVVTNKPVAKPEPEEPKIFRGEVLEPGKTLSINELSFKVDSYKILEDSKPALDDIFKFMQKNRKVSVEIGGHTNRFCDSEYCQELSTNRARAVVDYLISKGVDKNRLSFKGYGKTKPITLSKSATAQKKNQRVEIKIVSVGS